MGILMWEQPEKAMPVEHWQNIVADSAPPGVYSPNMSSEDMERWKAKLVGTTNGFPRVEIRKSVGVQMLIIVSLGQGFKQKYKSMPEGSNVQISMNGAAALTWDEWADFYHAILEAKIALEALQS